MNLQSIAFYQLFITLQYKFCRSLLLMYFSAELIDLKCQTNTECVQCTTDVH